MSLLQRLAARSGLGRALHLGGLGGSECSSSLAALAAPSAAAWSLRRYATLAEHQKEVDRINDKFVEARDEIEYAMEDAETVYFNESAQDAKEVVQQCLDMYEGLLAKLEPAERGKLERSMGLKMEQLKAEAAQLDTLHAD